MNWQDFADLCYDLIKLEHPEAKKLEHVRDGGADVFIGDVFIGENHFLGY